MEEVVIGRPAEVGLDLSEVLEVRAHGDEEAALVVVSAAVEVLAAEDQVGPGKARLW